MKAFLSRPLWVHAHVANHLRDLEQQLALLGFDVKTVGANVTSFASPFEEAVRVLSGCDCAIILGLPYLRVRAGTLKGQEIQTGFALPSEWNHIETAIAILLGKPTLMMLHHGVARRGLFDRGAANLFIHEFHTLGPKWVRDMVPKLKDLREKIGGPNTPPQDSSRAARILSGNVGSNQKMKDPFGIRVVRVVIALFAVGPLVLSIVARNSPDDLIIEIPLLATGVVLCVGIDKKRIWSWYGALAYVVLLGAGPAIFLCSTVPWYYRDTIINPQRSQLMPDVIEPALRCLVFGVPLWLSIVLLMRKSTREYFKKMETGTSNNERVSRARAR